MQKTHTLAEAEFGRDALAKVLSNLFLFHLFSKPLNLIDFNFFFYFNSIFP